MTAHELANILLSMPNVMVTVNGYEGGVNEISGIDTPQDLILNVHEEWYYGKHEYKEYYCLDNDVEYHIVKAINLK